MEAGTVIQPDQTDADLPSVAEIGECSLFEGDQPSARSAAGSQEVKRAAVFAFSAARPDGPADALRDTVDQYRKSLWTDANCLVQIWLEKDALSGVLSPVTSRYDVPLMVARGYSSLSFLNDAAEALHGEDRPVYVYHFGDHDPSGVNAAETIDTTLRELSDAEIHFQRVAVTTEQISRWRLPTGRRKTPTAAPLHSAASCRWNWTPSSRDGC